jgi:hypothetical protein
MSIIRLAALVISLALMSSSWSVLAADPEHALARAKADSSGHAAVADKSPALEKHKPIAANSSSSEKAGERSVTAAIVAAEPTIAQSAGNRQGDSQGDRQGDRDPLAANIIDDATLSTSRGGSDSHLDQNNSSGTVQANVATNLSTGTNTISQGAFSNSSGIPMVIQNSGNNVLIQNSTILNLQLLK